MQGFGLVQLDEKGRVASIHPSHRDRPLLEAKPESRYPLVLAWLEGHEQPTSDWRLALPATTQRSCVPPSGDGLEIVLESVPPSGGVLLRMEVLNRSAAPLQRLRFQIGGLLDIGPSPELTYPFNSGWSVPLAALGDDELLSLELSGPCLDAMGRPVHSRARALFWHSGSAAVLENPPHGAPARPTVPGLGISLSAIGARTGVSVPAAAPGLAQGRLASRSRPIPGMDRSLHRPAGSASLVCRQARLELGGAAWTARAAALAPRRRLVHVVRTHLGLWP